MNAYRLTATVGTLIVAALWSPALRAEPQTLVDPYTAPGVGAGRTVAFSIDDVATVDPFSGALKVAHTDLVFAGVGPTIAVRRNFNSHPIRAVGGGAPVLRPLNLMATGWDFHFGYVLFGDASGGGTANCDVFTVNPVKRRVPRVVFPDGTEMPMYQPTVASGNPHHFVARNGWVGDCLSGGTNGIVVTDPDGTQYRFDRWGLLAADLTAQRFGYLLTEVRDLHGNALTLSYNSLPTMDELVSVSATDGRQVNFIYENTSMAVRRLREVRAFYGASTVPRETWLYTYTDVPNTPGYSYLDRVDGPEGLRWSYTYVPSGIGQHDLATITSPWGATKSFEYDLRPVPVPVGLGTTQAVSRVTWSGPDIPQAEWTYVYAPDPAQGSQLDTTTITTPERVEVWTFCGERAIAEPSLDPLLCRFRIGSLERKEIYERNAQGGRGALLQTETFGWGMLPMTEQLFPHRHLANFFYSPVAIVRTEHTIERNGEQFTSAWWNYDLLTFKPTLLAEYRNGDLTFQRQRVLELWVEPTAWIVRTEHEHLNDIELTDHLTNQTYYVGSNGVTRVYNTDGTIQSSTSGGVTDTFTYRPDGLTATYTDYGGGGHFEARQYELGVVTELYSTGRDATLRRTINTEGYVGSVTDWEGHTTALEYDELGRVDRVTTPRTDDEDIVVTRNFTLRQEVVTRGARVLTTRFDSLGRVIETEVGGQVVRTEYDEMGRTVFSSDTTTGFSAQCVNIASGFNRCDNVPTGCPGTCTDYDTLGRVTRQLYTVDDSATTYSYPDPLTVVRTNAKGQVTTTTHERFGDPDEDRSVRIEEEEGVVTNISRYRNGEAFEIEQTGTGLHGPPRWRLLDVDDRLVAEFNPESHWQRLVYDPSGRLWRRYFEGGTVAEQNWIYYDYDAGDRLRNFGPLSVSERVAFTYDNNNRVLTNTYQGAVWTYVYDQNGNRTSESLAVDGRTFSIARGYDGLDHLESLTYPTTRSIDYAPDVLGRPTRVGAHVTTVAYHPNGALARLQYANGHTIRYTQDADKPLLPRRIAGGPIDLTYTYDVIGNVDRIDDAVLVGHDITLGYDHLNRLTSATGSWGTAGYGYDVKNGFTEMTLNGLTTTYTHGYNRTAGANQYLPHRLESTDGRLPMTLSYDRRGNMTRSSASAHNGEELEWRRDSFQYDWRNRPTQHTHQQIGLATFFGTPAERVELSKSTTLRYDGHGMRIQKNADHYYIYSGDQLLYEEDQQERTAREYLYAGLLGVAEVVEDCTDASETQPWCASGDHPPKVAILSPRADARPEHRDDIVLEAVAFDAEDGDLAANVQWYQALSTVIDLSVPPPETYLGQGQTLNVGRLGVGFHRIEARLSHGVGQEVVDSVQFEIVAGPNTAPTISASPSRIATPVDTLLSADMSAWFNDVDGDVLTYTVSNLPSWLSVVGSQLVGTPTSRDAGATVTIEAFDGLESSPPLMVEVDIDAPDIVWVGTPLGDTFYAGPGDDTLDGADGNDNLRGYAGDDHIDGGNGNDLLEAGVGNDVVLGGDGFDQLFGGDGNDRLEGGPGEPDFLYGERGDDLFIYRAGTGLDYIYDRWGNDEIHFVDILPADVSFQHNGSQTSNTPDTQFSRVFDRTGQQLMHIGHEGGLKTEIEVVRFMDGSLWTVEDLIARNISTQGDDLLYGGPGDDVMHGGEGNDLLVGNEGADTLYGGPGDDVLYGGYSSIPADDTFIFSQPIGNDIVYDYYGDDTFRFEDVASSDIGFIQHHQDLILVGPGWRIEFYGHWAPVSFAKLERLEFSDGVVWNQAQLEAAYNAAVNP